MTDSLRLADAAPAEVARARAALLGAPDSGRPLGGAVLRAVAEDGGRKAAVLGRLSERVEALGIGR